MRIRRKGRITAFLLAGILIFAGCTGKQPAALQNIQDAENDKEFHISDITPATDYYGYMNAETLMNMQLEPGSSMAGITIDMTNNMSDQLDGLIDEIVASKKEYPKGSNEQLIRDIYNLMVAFCEGDEKKDQSDEAIITGLLERTNQISDMEELIDYWYELSLDYAVQTPFNAYVMVDIYDTSRNVLFVTESLPVNLVEISSSDIDAGIERDKLKASLCLSGLDEPVARERSTDMIYMFSGIAGKCEFEDEDEEDKDKTRDYIYYSREEVSEHFSNLSYERLCMLLGYKDRIPERLCIPYIDQIEAIEATFDNDHLQEWKDCTIVQILDDSDGFFPKKYSQDEPDPKKADKKAKSTIKKLLESQLAEVYVEKYEDARKVKLATEICNDLKEEYYVLINQADWMSEEGKAYCRSKLDSMEFFIGSDEPHEIKEEHGDVIGDTIYQTCLNYQKYVRTEKQKKLFEPVERNGFTVMSPITINACYVPSLNCIVIPTAYMSDEMLDLNKSYEWNLGGMGSTIGHEISHAFDSSGIRFDDQGNFVPEAMPEADREAFKALQEKAVDYYSSFTFFGSHINGRKTLGENFADISGLQACLEIAGTPEKQKTVLESYAVSYCGLCTDDLLKNQIATDEHAPDNIRVNAVVSIFDCFYEIYDVKEGDPMYVAPENRIRRW